MWLPFFLQHLHFSLNVLAAIIMLGLLWLYSDAWIERPTKRELFRMVGLFVLALSYIIEAVGIEGTLIGSVHPLLIPSLVLMTRLPGVLFLLLSLILDPLPQHPETKPLSAATFRAGVAVPTAVTSVLSLLSFLPPILLALVGWLYLRRATIGLERHLRLISYGWFCLSFSALCSLSRLFATSQATFLAQMVAPYGVIWWLGHLFLLGGIILMGRWLWHYLLTRFQTQLMFVFVIIILVSFLATAVTFTALLLNNIRHEALAQLRTNGRVLQYALDSTRAATLSDASLLAESPEVRAAIAGGVHEAATERAAAFLGNKQASTVMIVDAQGKVLARGEDRDHFGDSRSGDPLIRQALLGKSIAAVTTHEGVDAPRVAVQAAVPVRQDGALIGAVMIGRILDTVFVDGLRQATSLEASIYGNDLLAATTIVGPDGASRWVGAREVNEAVTRAVLTRGEDYVGPTTFFTTPYLSAYVPLRDADGLPAGMLAVGHPEQRLLETASRSLELTFMMTALLLVLALVPAYIVAKQIAYQLG